MSDLSEIRDYLKSIDSRTHDTDKKLDSHIAETKVYREMEKGTTHEHHVTLYDKEHGLVYGVDRLKESQKTSEKNSKMLMGLFGVPIVGLLLESAWKFFTAK